MSIVKRPELRIEAPTLGKDSRVWLDGVEISHMLRGWQVSANVGSATQVDLEVLPKNVDVLMANLKAVNVKIHVDSSELDEAIRKAELLARLQDQSNGWGFRLLRSWRTFRNRYHAKRDEVANAK